jgi:hypothetical protein
MAGVIMTLPATSPETLLRLRDAARLAFPDGSMTESGLRRERDRGRLVVWLVANKEYTTLSSIREMLDQCRVHPSQRACASKAPPRDAPPSGTSSTDESDSPLAAARATLAALKGNSPSISRSNTRRRAANVLPFKSPSPMS